MDRMASLRCALAARAQPVLLVALGVGYALRKFAAGDALGAMSVMCLCGNIQEGCQCCGRGDCDGNLPLVDLKIFRF
jgi:hypothetical protein